MPPRRHRGSGSASAGDDGAKLVVRNTFFELSVDDATEAPTGRRPRAQTDCLDRTRAPRKVTYNAPAHVGGSGGGAAAAAYSAAMSSPGAGFGGMPMLPFGMPGIDPFCNPHGIPPMMMPPAGGMPPYPGWDWSWMYPPGATTGPYGYPPADEMVGHRPSGKGRGKGEKKGAAATTSSGGKVKAEGAEKQQDAAEAKRTPTAPPHPPEKGTTVMLRNIPNRYMQSSLLGLIDENGFNMLYDFVYLPIDFRNGVNLGYAFVNLLTHEDALRFMAEFKDFSKWSFDSVKVCEVSWAHPHQGLEEHVERYRHSPVMHPSTPDDYKPMVFKDGVRIPFPGPRKAIKAPKLKPAAQDSPKHVPVPASS